MNYIIKEIDKDDLYDYMYVNTTAWNESYKGIIDDDFLDKIKREFNQNVERQRNKFDETKINEPDYKRFLLYIDKEPVGMFSICKSREEIYQDSGELCSIYLLDKVKKQGYGRILFEKAKEELKELNFKDMVISCLKDNPTNEFYKYMGGILVATKNKNIGGKDYEENIYYYENI